MQLDFKHKPSGHCENGVVSNLLGFYGINISEAMVFGLGSGLFFAHMPFIKLHGMAVTSFRPLPGAIFSRVMSLLGIKMKRYKFRDKEKSMAALDKVLFSGTPVGMLVGVYNLPYFPAEYRFHFNAHNICVIGKEGDLYTVSDPVVVEKCMLTYEELKTVRFAKGTYPPSGRMYHITDVSHKKDVDSETIRKSILHNCNRMTKIPIPMFGVNGIRFLARRMRRWERSMGKKRAALNLAQVIRMNEEIGTGGAGFRFIYAAFLQEAAELTGIAELNDFSMRVTKVGDLWREFAYKASRIYKRREGENYTYDDLGDILQHIGEMERSIFRELDVLVKSKME